MVLLLSGVLVMLAGALVALGLYTRPEKASTVAAAALGLGVLLISAPVIGVLGGADTLTFEGRWPMPNGALSLALDPLSAFFLVPVLVLAVPCALYGRAYLLGEGPHAPTSLPFFGFNLLVASMVVVLLAQNGVLFLLCWEAMAVAAFFLVAYHHEDPKARRAGWVYLIATHVGAAALFAMFLLLARGAGGYGFAAFARSPPEGALAWVVMALALVGFGAKAGFVPLHVWLPEAHAAAPSHVSALMSGALIKLGIYGVLRVHLVMGGGVAFLGPALAGLGLFGALLAICLALYQRDLKRALAYSSVENVGLVALGLGVALIAAQQKDARIAALAMGGGLLHLWNHALMKGTLFLAAGSVVHATGERDLERLGGLAARMPLTVGTFTLGAVAISGLPPLNGFAGEWLLYQALIQAGLEAKLGGVLVALLSVGLLSLIGALTALSLVRLLGIGLLGQPRSAQAAGAHESSRWLTFPALGLGAACVAVGLAPALALSATSRVAAQLLAPAGLRALEPQAALLPQLGWLNLLLWGLLGAVALVVLELRGGQPQAVAETWGCGYAAPTERMQYRGRSFAELFSERVLPRLLRPKVRETAPQGLFAARASLESDDADPFTRGVYEPTFLRWAGRLSSFGWVQQGVLQLYLLYIVVAMVLGLAWVTFGGWVRP